MYSDFFSRCGSMIPLSVPEISALGGFCDAREGRAGRGIGYSSRWMIMMMVVVIVVVMTLMLFRPVRRARVKESDGGEPVLVKTWILK